MPECRPQRGAFETWILCSGVEIDAFTDGAATGCGGADSVLRKKPNNYRYIPPAVVGMLEIAMQACQVSSESIGMRLLDHHASLQNLPRSGIWRRILLGLKSGRHGCVPDTWVHIALAPQVIAELGCVGFLTVASDIASTSAARHWGGRYNLALRSAHVEQGE